MTHLVTCPTACLCRLAAPRVSLPLPLFLSRPHDLRNICRSEVPFQANEPTFDIKRLPLPGALSIIHDTGTIATEALAIIFAGNWDFWNHI
ncbi:Cell shape-determining protein MreC [Trichinella spiralis]|uniref:Cell shape-determining protein MreC n=1 Tax=Trichinella spiralis TaxID=6334 RepID=A0ABR3K8I2_TRISP